MTMKTSALVRRLVPAVLASAAILLVACGKKPQPGAACKEEGTLKCVDKASALACTNGKWEKVTCNGISGCETLVGDSTCTYDGYVAGEPCTEEGKPECSTDKKAMLKCEAKHWKQIDTCDGQNGCVANALGAKCDKGKATVGSSCTADNEGNAACSPDGKALLICRSGKMALGAACKGMHGCREQGTKIDCNQTIADLGDPCDGYEGRYACSSDKKERLVCKQGKMAKDKACKSCSVLIDEVQCS
jgi:hypothetical protein